MSDVLTSDKGKTMLGYLPPYYHNSQVMKSILQAEGMEFDKLVQALSETLSQFFVKQADWSLDTWEDELGLVNGEATMTTAERQDRILAKLRSAATATLARIKSVAESYRRAKVYVIEDHRAYNVIVRLVGLPTNIADLQAAIQDIIPGHLGITWEYGYLDWDRLDSYGWTFNNLDSLALTWDKLEVYVIA
jgi:hypothetical protein